jgi:hypothetical protein
VRIGVCIYLRQASNRIERPRRDPSRGNIVTDPSDFSAERAHPDKQDALEQGGEQRGGQSG